MIKLFLAGLPGGGALVAIWSFLTSTIGMVLIASTISYGVGYSHADRKADIAKLNAEIATLKSDRDTSENARVLAERQSTSLEAHQKSNEDRVKAITAELEQRKRELAKKPGSVPRNCGLSAPDVHRLLQIR